MTTNRQKEIKKADDAWARAVKRKFRFRCQKPGCKKKGILNSHHCILPRGAWAARYEVNNGLCLCQGCHKFWAHVYTEECRDVVLTIVGSIEFNRIKALKYATAHYSVKDLNTIAANLDKMFL